MSEKQDYQQQARGDAAIEKGAPARGRGMIVYVHIGAHVKPAK
jgi:hypothetical protein